MQIRVKDFRRRTIYHSPQMPGFTSWTGIWKMPDGDLMLCFTQATGPLDGWRPRAPSEVRHRLSWPPTGQEGYDMTGLLLENVHLKSADGGESWAQVSAEVFASPMNGCTGEGEVALEDGTILRAVWGHYLPFWDVPQTGYVQRSADGTRTWGPPELLSQDDRLQTWPKRVRLLGDGRIVITGAAAEYEPGNWTREEVGTRLRFCLWVSLDKDGGAWSEPLYVAPEKAGYAGEEFDIAELDNGDLLAVYRTETFDASGNCVSQERRQNLLVKKGGNWKTTPVVDAPFPHSGHPELLATREGVVLHIATNGTWWTGDRGAHWTKTDVPGSTYYPRSIQLDDGTIMVVGHVGGDNAYGDIDQSIVMDTYRIVVEE